MIAREITLTMLCDKCGGKLIDDYGQVVKISDKNFEYEYEYYNAIYKIAKEKGWSCTRSRGCLCPSCRKDNAE